MPTKPKLPWNASSKKGSSTSVNSDNANDNDALRKIIAEQAAKITELEARMTIVDVIDKNLDNLSSNELKQLCMELDNGNKKLREKLEISIHEKENMLAQMSHKMHLVMNEKDKQIKRQEALGADDNKDKSTKALGNSNNKQIRMAISAETAKTVDPKKLPKIPKSKEDKNYIQKSLEGNQFFRGLKSDQISKIIDCMEKKKLKSDVEIIREGTDGTYLYLLEEGIVTIYNQESHIADLHEGKIFGELAILYNCNRTASVRTKTECTVYQLDRRYYKTIVQSTGAARDEARLNALKLVPKLKDLSDAKLKKIADCMEDEVFSNDDCIIKQGTAGDLFYIIKEGKVRCTKNRDNGEEEEVAVLEKGNFFGELALQTEDKRAANVYAIGDVKCLSLDRHAFISLIGRIDDAKSSIAEEDEKEIQVSQPTAAGGLDKAALVDVRVLKSLGQGGFGDVKLVYFKNSAVEAKPYALKCVQKCRIVQYGQQRHIMDEKNILFMMKSPFILTLHKTFKDSKQVYLLTDAYLGGDLWRLLHARGPFPDTVARFYIACVVEAFGYLHSRGIVYRDLKPENLMLHTNGYLRLVDLGFAKRVPIGSKTWTFCGTPEYIPPEVIANTGHTLSADYWSLGILVYELVTRKTPFRAKDDLTIYENILRGVHSVQFSYRISRKAEMLIKSLCRQEPAERLGYQKGGIGDIRKHKWFGGFDWEGFQAQRVPAPILPDVKNPMDNTDKAVHLDNASHIPEETSGWDADF